MTVDPNKHQNNCLSNLIYLCGEDFSGLVWLEDGWRAWSNIIPSFTPMPKPIAANGHDCPEDAVKALLNLIIDHKKAEGGVCNHLTIEEL